MEKISVRIKKKLAFCLVLSIIIGIFLTARVAYIEIFKSEFLQP